VDRRTVGTRTDPEQLRSTGCDTRDPDFDADAQAVSSRAAQHVQRIQKTLEDANLKIASVVSDVMGVSGRAILHALIELSRRTAGRHYRPLARLPETL